MSGIKGMNKNGRMGGAGRGQGRKKSVYRARFEKHQIVIIEREVIGGEIAPPLVYQFLEVSEGGTEITLQSDNGNEILTIRHPTPEEKL